MTSPAGILKTWSIAVRPFAYTASVLSVVLGLAVSVYLGHPVRWGLFALTLLGVVFFHTAANLLNDCFDHRRGLDTEVQPVSGAVVRGLLTERQAFRAAALFAALGAACGTVLVFSVGWVVLLLGVIGGFLALTYTTPGVCSKYMGLGDLTIFLAFGVLPVFGTFWVQTRTFDWHPVLWSVPVVLPTVGILHANNWRDIETDPAKGCHTFASFLGDRGSAAYYAALTLGPFVLIALYFVAARLLGAGFRAPARVFLGVLALPVAIQILRSTRQRTSGDKDLAFASLDAQTAKLHLVFGVLLSLGFFLGRAFPVLG